MNYHWNWSVFFREVPSGGATYIDWLLSGLGWTVAVALSAWALAFTLGSLLGVMRTLPNRLLSGIAAAYVEVFRNIPLLVQLFIWFYVVPELLPRGIGDAIKQRDPTTSEFLTAFVALGFFTAARICEQVRAGIGSLAKGQLNASLAVGFTLAQTYRYVLLPMAFRVVIPPLTSEFLNIFKNSAVALTVGLFELTAQTRQITEYTAQTFEAFIVTTLLYLMITMIVIVGMRWVEKRARVPGYISGA